MNMLIFELKKEIKSSIIWTISLVVVLYVFIEGIYPLFSDSIDSLISIISNYPQAFLDAFNFEIYTMLSFEGFYSFAYTYIVLIGAIMAVSLSLATFSREKRSKSSDFIFTKPISRKQIFFIKFLSNLITIILTNIIFMLFGIILYVLNTDESFFESNFLLCLLALFFTQIIFLGFGVFLAVFLKKIRSVSGTAITVGFATFFISAIANIIDEELMGFISPQRYFDPYFLSSHDFYDLKYVLFAIAVFIICMFVSVIKFVKSDISSI